MSHNSKKYQSKTTIDGVEYKFFAEVFEDGSGEFEVLKRSKKHFGNNKWHQIECEESGGVDDWLKIFNRRVRENAFILDQLENVAYGIKRDICSKCSQKTLNHTLTESFCSNCDYESGM